MPSLEFIFKKCKWVSQVFYMNMKLAFLILQHKYVHCTLGDFYQLCAFNVKQNNNDQLLSQIVSSVPNILLF